MAKGKGDERDIPDLTTKSYATAVKSNVCPEPALILGAVASHAGPNEAFTRKMMLAGPSKAQKVVVKLDTGAEGTPCNYVRASTARSLGLEEVPLEKVIQVVGEPAPEHSLNCTHYVLLVLFDPNWKIHLELKALLLPEQNPKVRQFQVILGANAIARHGLMELNTHGGAFTRQFGAPEEDLGYDDLLAAPLEAPSVKREIELKQQLLKSPIMTLGGIEAIECDNFEVYIPPSSLDLEWSKQVDRVDRLPKPAKVLRASKELRELPSDPG